MDRKKSLRALVYTGLAGGLVGVTSMSAAAHGNASSHVVDSEVLSWQADDFVVKHQELKPQAQAEKK